MTNQDKITNKKKVVFFYIITFLIPIIIIVPIYLIYIGYRSVPLYNYIKTKQRGWSGKVHKADKELGWVAVSNSKGAHVFPIGHDIPMRYDKNGFRIPVDDKKTSLNQQPIVLALGCSFTYGDANYAEDTFPYLVGQFLGGSTMNAGKCSYGLSHMLILARRLIPKHKPDYILVQYSPWLTQRSQKEFSPSRFAKRTSPFFYEDDSGLKIHYPVFQTKEFDLPVDIYRESPREKGDFISFIWDVGFPLFFHDDVNMSIFEVKKNLNIIPNPTSNSQKIEKYVYGEIADLIKKNNGRMIIIVLGKDYKPVKFPKHIIPLLQKDSIIVDAHTSLLENLPFLDFYNYIFHYGHLRGSPLRIVDQHPNKTAHRIIAEKVILKIKEKMEEENNLGDEYRNIKLRYEKISNSENIIGQYQNDIKANPSNFESYINLANTYRINGEKDKAAELYKLIKTILSKK